MNPDFYLNLSRKHQFVKRLPSNEKITSWATQIIQLLFPEQSDNFIDDPNKLRLRFSDLENELRGFVNAIGEDVNPNVEIKAWNFFQQIPELYRVLNTDVSALFMGDPAASSEFEVIRTYPGFIAISFYRLAHMLHRENIPILPRIITEYAHSKTGIDIHPAASIGEYFYIDHGTGTVIGESCQIGHHVKLYQGVTLGALSVNKNMANAKRHPTVGNNVIIYAGATILGGETVIGNGSIIGGNVWITKSIEPLSTLRHTSHYRTYRNCEEDSK